jgi:hypothetical protein
MPAIRGRLSVGQQQDRPLWWLMRSSATPAAHYQVFISRELDALGMSAACMVDELSARI